MSTTIASPVPAETAPLQPRSWTRAEYYRLAEMGFFRGQRAERIGGAIIVMSPQNWPHTSATDRVAEMLRNTFGPATWVRTQMPIMLGQTSDPEPDVSVVPGTRDDYTDHPTTALLIVEISDTSLTYDRTSKASLYAAAGIGDYWIVNLNDRQLEVLRDPQPDSSQAFGWRYLQTRTLRPGDSIAPLALPQTMVAVAELLG